MWREISEIMSRDVATIYNKANAAEAAAVMSGRGISGIVVMGTEGVVGILTERDFLKRVVATGRDPASVKVEDVMSYPVVTVPSYYSVFSCSRIMEKMHIRRLIVEDNKRLVGVVTQTDIFRAVEGRLRQEEEDNFRLLETSDVCIYTLDLDGNVTYINPACMKLLGVEDRAELVGQSFLPERFWYNPQDRYRFLKELKKGVVEIKDLTLKTARGRRIDVTFFSSFTKNIHGRLNGSQGVLRDVTDKKELVMLKEAERALRASEDRYRRITEAVTD
jgi:PAS domain S-box-containing protein